MLKEFSYDDLQMIRHEMDNSVDINFFKKYAIGFCPDERVTTFKLVGRVIPMIFQVEENLPFYFHVVVDSVIRYGFPDTWEKYFKR